MKLIILKNSLIEALGAIEKTMKEISSLPILKTVYIKTDGGKILFTGTNLELAITHTSSGKIIDTGEVVVPFQIFNTVVKNLNSERINLELKGKKLFISTENYEASFQTQNPEEFPIIPSIHNTKQFIKTNTGSFVEVLETVIPATQYSEIRPEISGVFIQSDNYGVTFVATNGFRLSERKTTEDDRFESNLGELKAIIPLKTIEEIVRIFSGKDEDLSIFFDSTQVLFQTNTVKAISRLIDGNFPDYQQIIPKKTKTEIIISRQEFIQAVKLTSSFSGKGNDVRISVGDNKKYIEINSANETLGENNYKIPIKLKGEKLSLLFNWKYLLDGLRVYKSRDVIIGIDEPDKPMMIKSPQEPLLLYIVMPIKG